MQVNHLVPTFVTYYNEHTPLVELYAVLNENSDSIVDFLLHIDSFNAGLQRFCISGRDDSNSSPTNSLKGTPTNPLVYMNSTASSRVNLHTLLWSTY